MTNTVTVNGNTYTDDASPTTGMAAGGFRARLLPMISDTIAYIAASLNTIANNLTNSNTAATNAAASASSALNAPGTNATSTTSLTIGAGAQSFTIQTGKAFALGQTLLIASTASPTNWMSGQVTAFNSGAGTATINVTLAGGSGTFAAWTVSLTGPQGKAGTLVRRFATIASSATPTPVCDTTDIFTVTALAAAATFQTPTFAIAPTDGQGLQIRIKDNGTARLLAFTSAYRFSPNLPALTTTLVNKTMYLGFEYNAADSKWDCVAILDNFT